MHKFDTISLALAIEAAKAANLPLKGVDFDASGGFRIIANFDAVDWATVELYRHSDRFPFSQQTLSEIKDFLKVRAVATSDAAPLTAKA